MKWEFHAIKDVYEGLYDGPHATPPVCDDGAIFLGISNISENGHLDFSDIKYISEADLPRWTKRVTPKTGDIVFSYEAGLNRYAIIPEGFHGCLGRRMALIRPNEKKALGKFLYYYFFSAQWRETIAANTIIGTTVDRIPLIKFPKFPVSIPDLNVQRRIVDILSAYDNLIEVNNKRIKVLEQMAENLYKEWFVRFRFPGHESVPFENGLPQGWKPCRFSSIANILSGGTPSTEHEEYYGGDIPFYTPKDSVDHLFVFDTTLKLTEDGLSHCNSQLYPKDTIMITARGTVGNLNLLATPMAMNQSCYALNSNVIRSQYFLFYMIKREVLKLKKMASGGVFDTIIVNTFDHIKVLLPTDETIESFDKAVSPLIDQIYNLMEANRNLIKQRDLLLPRMMSGKIIP